MKEKALTELRRLYKEYLKTNSKALKQHRLKRYLAARELTLSIGLLDFQTLETMEVEQQDLIGGGE